MAALACRPARESLAARIDKLPTPPNAVEFISRSLFRSEPYFAIQTFFLSVQMLNLARVAPRPEDFCFREIPLHIRIQENPELLRMRPQERQDPEVGNQERISHRCRPVPNEWRRPTRGGGGERSR